MCSDTDYYFDSLQSDSWTGYGTETDLVARVDNLRRELDGDGVPVDLP